MMKTKLANNYESLIHKLDEFIRKYYKNKMIRGAIYSVALVLCSYLIVVLLEYFGRFNIALRTFLFWGFIAAALTIVIRFFLIPLSHMFRLGKIISHSQAASIIGRHFPEVQDKLLNTLQLHELSSQSPENNLLEASIQQRIASLKPVSFTSAIDLKQNRKYLKYAVLPIAAILVILFAAPSVLTKPTERLIRHGQLIAELAPFAIHVENNPLQTPENTDFTVNISLSGEEIPDKVYLDLNGQNFLLEKKSPIQFSYTFRNVQKNTPFAFFAGGFHSDSYELKVLPAPALVDFEVNLSYPAYLKRTAETLKNTGDLTIPEGTKINWQFFTRNTENIVVHYGDSSLTPKGGGNHFTLSQVAMGNSEYSVHVSNNLMVSPDSISYRIEVIPDLAPMIAVKEERDSASFKQLYFTGEIKDDYGFRRLTFNYQFINTGKGERDNSPHTIEMPVSKEFPADKFFFDWNLDNLGISPGDKIAYFFEVWDNDGVHGSKSTRSEIREYAAPSLDEIDKSIDQKNDDIKDKLEESIKDAKKLQKEMEDMQRQLLEKQQMSWQDKKKMEELMKKQEELSKQVREIQQKNQQKDRQQGEFRQQNESILQKQEQLQQLMEQIMTPEMQKMMEELQRMMDELNKDELQRQLEQMNLTNEDIEKELDRALEQFKQLEWKQKMEKTIEKIEKLAEEQEKLSEDSEKKDSQSGELKKEQEKLNEKFDDVKKEMEELEKMNEEMENPNDMPENDQQKEEIGEEMKKSTEDLQNNKKSSASKSQKSASQKMKDMAAEMQMAMQSGEEEQQQEDMEALRALLENIVTLSFDQEELMANFKKVDMKDPKYNKLGQVQRKLKDDARMVEDSLFALSKRVPEISAAVNREINLVNENMDKALGSIPDRRTPEITTSQQYVMTSFNNLALMLDEALQQMQSQASSNKPGQGNCNKPGGNGKKPKPSAGDIKKMQESLSKQLEEMKKKGQNKGENKGANSQMSKQLAEMAAQQAAIRKMMEEKAGELNEDGSGNGNELKQISKEMEQLQKDIVNNQISEESLRRQQDIMIRLLKAENAERVREQENQRKSNEAHDFPTSNPMKYEEYMRRKEQETELLKTLPPNLKPYYKEKANSYFNKIGQ
ncbi:MAG: DUF4175 domain-containing protein [Crocinitomicaceae bacterium]|nr:DUF4175 domain-containing protein [Crocinitomicaceae bacterium]